MDLLGDRAAAKRLGAAARQTVIDHYDVTQCTEKWKSLILRTINNKYPKLN